MKWAKFLPVLTAAAVLAACSNPAPSDVKAEQKVELPTTTKIVVYQCLAKKNVTATYTFSGEDVKSAQIMLGKTALGEFTKDDSASPDFTTFVNGDYSLVAGSGLTLSNVDKIEGGNLVKKGKKSDEILAKLCQPKLVK